MDIDDEKDENELELTFLYEHVDPLNPPPPASDSEPEDVIKVEDTVEPEDEIVPASVHEVAHALVEKKGKAKDEYYGKLILDLGNETRVQAYEFYQEMIRKGVVFEKRPNEAIDVSVEDEESPSSEPQGSPRDS
ncbi:hypothetical protein Tco_0024286 [Tanacetum coccineum]